MIINELFYQEISKLFSDIHAELADIQDPSQHIRMFITKTLDAVTANSQFFNVYVRSLADKADTSDTSKMLTTFYDRYIQELSALLQQGIDSKSFDAVDVTCVCRAAYSLMVGAIFIKHVMKVDFDLHEQNSCQIDLLLQAIVSK